MDLIYFDNAATTRPHSSVNRNIEFINEKLYYNPSSSHKAGIDAEKILEGSRQSAAAFIGARQSEIIFTSGGTESINIALRGIFRSHGKKRKQLISTMTEHSAVYETLKDLSMEGADIKFVDIDKNGAVKIDSIISSLSENTLMVTLTHVNNETGAVNPVKQLAAEIKSYDPGIMIHIDAVQSFGKFALTGEFSMVDLFSCSAHKVHGPKGTGLLYRKNGTKLCPVLTGGEQEKGLRPGTVNLPSVYAFAELLPDLKAGQSSNFLKVSSLKNTFMEMISGSGLLYEIPFRENTSPYILNIVFPGIKSEILMHHLEEKNIIVSAGAACSSRKKTHRVLEGYGLSKTAAESAIRISFSELNTMDEIKRLLEALKEILPKLPRI